MVQPAMAQPLPDGAWFVDNPARSLEHHHSAARTLSTCRGRKLAMLSLWVSEARHAPSRTKDYFIHARIGLQPTERWE